MVLFFAILCDKNAMCGVGVMEEVWKAMPRQALALSCPSYEIFFGGAKGGGKTDWLLADYLSQLEMAKSGGLSSRGILFRRSFKELEEVVARSQEIYSKLGGEFSRSRTTWTFGGIGTLRMRFCDNDNDSMKYQGHSYDWIGFDELGNYPTPYLFSQLQSCNRHAGGLRTRMCATGNPGGPGQAWLKRRYISGKKPDTIYKYTREYHHHGKTLIDELTRCFIPSKVTDNEYILKNDPGYILRLSGLPKHLRDAYLNGDWNVSIGQAFSDITEIHKCEPFTIPYDWPKFSTMDWGYQKPYSLGLWAVDPGIGRLYRVGELYGCVNEDEGVLEDAKTAGKKFLAITNAMGISRNYVDPACWARQGHGNTIAEILKNVGFAVIPADRDRVASKSTFHTLLQERKEDGLPGVMVFSTCEHWWRTVPNLVSDKRNIEDVDTRGEDHAYDDTRFAVMAPEVTQGVVMKNKVDYSGFNYIQDRDYAR